MEISGKVIKILPVNSGTSANGQWIRGGFVLETFDTYPRKIAFTAFGEDRVGMIGQLMEGATVNVTFTVESREYQERWYTDCRLVSVQMQNAAQQQPAYNGVSGQYAQPIPPQYPPNPAVQTFPPQNPMPQQAPQTPVTPQTPQAGAGAGAGIDQFPNQPEDDLPF